MAIYLSNRDGNGRTSEEGHYRLQTRILKGVVLKTNDLKVTQTSPLTLGVKVGTGDYRIDTPEGYAYTGWLTSEETLTLITADSANPRISLVIIYVDKTAATAPGTPNNPGVTKLLAIPGTPASIPVAPTTAAIQTVIGNGNPFAILAEIRVNAGVTTVNDTNITDVRVRVSLIDEILQSANLKSIIGPVMYPIGSLYTNTSDATNPATLLGFGTWIAFGTGRVLVGIDASQVEFDTIGETGGTKSTTLIQSNLPNVQGSIGLHSGERGSQFIDVGGVFNVRRDVRGSYIAPNGTTAASQSVYGNLNFDLNGGAQTSQNNLAPYITVYMWRRTA